MSLSAFVWALMEVRWRVVARRVVTRRSVLFCVSAAMTMGCCAAGCDCGRSRRAAPRAVRQTAALQRLSNAAALTAGLPQRSLAPNPATAASAM